MTIDRRTLADYDHARRRAFWRQLGSFLIRRRNDLLPFEEVRQRLHAQTQHDSGYQEVPIDKIVGSVGRYRDFDRAFLPLQKQTQARWLSIDKTYYQSVTLPPVELYKLGETYFVKDGNHRVSVAREQGQEFVDARVVEVDAPVPISSVAELEEWIRHQDAVDFLDKTRLTELRPDARVELTLPGQYEKLLEHIDVHRWYMGVERKREVAYADAVASWYDNVYLPLVRIIRECDVLREFPHRTEADLYLWIIEHRWFLTQSGQLSEDAPLDQIVRRFADQFTQRPLKRLLRSIFGALHRATGLVLPRSN
jgi:hypothetical protein